MNNVYVSELTTDSSDVYRSFLNENKGNGILKIRANSINEAIPVSSLRIIVSTKYINDNLIFFDGYTDESGMINDLTLPTPILSNDLNVPLGIVYNIDTFINNIKKSYSVILYDGVEVLQNINIIPSFGDNRYGS